LKPKIITLTAPYDSLESNDELGENLLEMFRLKLRGYRDVYEYGVLPVDAYDFISTHHLFGFETEGPFRPLMAFRTIEMDKCDLHGMPYPGLTILRSSGAHLHADTLLTLLNRWKGQRVSYASSWTMAPNLRLDRPVRDFLRDMMVTMLMNHELDRKTDHKVLCGVPKVHTDKLFERYGYERVKANGEPLPPFPQASLMGEEAVLLHCERFSDEALEIAAKHRHIWDARRIVGDTEAVTPAAKKAA
jgi:hypothetical protein